MNLPGGRGKRAGGIQQRRHGIRVPLTRRNESKTILNKKSVHKEAVGGSSDSSHVFLFFFLDVLDVS